MTDPLRRAGLIGLAVVLFALASTDAAIRVYSTRFQPAADLGIDFDEEGLRLAALREGGPADRAGLRPHDRLVAIDDVPVKKLLEVRDAVRRAAPGEFMRLTVELAALNRPRTYEVKLDPRPEPPPPSALALVAWGLRSAIPFLAIALSIGLVLLRIDRLEAWLLALATIGALEAAPLLAIFDKIPPPARGFTLAFKILFGGAAPALAYSFLAVFPDSPSLDRLYPRIKSVWLLGSVAVAAPFAVSALISGGEQLYHSSWPAAGRWITGLGWIAALGLGAISLWENCTGVTTREAIPQARVVAAGLGAALAPAILFGFSHGAWARLLGVSGYVLLPLAAGYAILAPEVLPVSALLRRGTRFLVVRREGALVPIVAIAALGALAFGQWVASRFGPVGGGLAALAAGALVVFAGRAAHDRVRALAERSLFRAEWEARRTIEDLSTKLAPAMSVAEVLDVLDCELRRVFRPSRIAVYLAAGEDRLRIERGEVPKGMEEIPLDANLPGAEAASTVGALEHATRIGPDCVAPIRRGEAGLLGLVVLSAREADGPFTAEELRLADVAGHEAGAALARVAEARMPGVGS